MDLAILGAGSWGTALAVELGPRFRNVRLWAFDPGLADQINDARENKPYLPGFRLADNVRATDDLAECLTGAGVVLLVAPSQHLRKVVRQAAPLVQPETLFVSATKGIQTGTLVRMSEIVRHECPFPARVATLSGPTFAREIAMGQPAAVVIASPDLELAATI